MFIHYLVFLLNAVGLKCQRTLVSPGEDVLRHRRLNPLPEFLIEQAGSEG